MARFICHTTNDNMASRGHFLKSKIRCRSLNISEAVKWVPNYGWYILGPKLVKRFIQGPNSIKTDKISDLACWPCPVWLGRGHFCVTGGITNRKVALARLQVEAVVPWMPAFPRSPWGLTPTTTLASMPDRCRQVQLHSSQLPLPRSGRRFVLGLCNVWKLEGLFCKPHMLSSHPGQPLT